jgi:hypothetical protein
LLLLLLLLLLVLQHLLQQCEAQLALTAAHVSKGSASLARLACRCGTHAQQLGKILQK